MKYIATIFMRIELDDYCTVFLKHAVFFLFGREAKTMIPADSRVFFAESSQLRVTFDVEHFPVENIEASQRKRYWVKFNASLSFSQI